MTNILQNALKKGKPSPKEILETEKKANSFLAKLNLNLKNARAIVGGSFAKGTWLKGRHDVDVFAMFPDDNGISDKLEKALLKTFGKAERVHGSRDYFQIRYLGLDFEIVPALEIDNFRKAKNVTDVSPLHIQWVLCHLGDKLRDDARLAKMFAKSSGCYGAETYIKGFSGYVLEILIAYYNGFENLVKSAVKWKEGDVINISGADVHIDKNKLSSLVVVDPAQPGRNANAALSPEKFEKFKEHCRKFISHKRMEFFVERKIKLKDLSKHDIVFIAEALDGKRDIVGTKLLKAFSEIGNRIEKEGFGIAEMDWHWKEGEKAYFWYDVWRKKLSAEKKHYGPPLSRKINLLQFRQKYKGHQTGVENGRAFAVVRREFTDVFEFAKHLIESERVKGNAKRIKITSE